MKKTVCKDLFDEYKITDDSSHRKGLIKLKKELNNPKFEDDPKYKALIDCKDFVGKQSSNYSISYDDIETKNNEIDNCYDRIREMVWGLLYEYNTKIKRTFTQKVFHKFGKLFDNNNKIKQKELSNLKKQIKSYIVEQDKNLDKYGNNLLIYKKYLNNINLENMENIKNSFDKIDKNIKYYYECCDKIDEELDVLDKEYKILQAELKTINKINSKSKYKKSMSSKFSNSV